MTLTLTGADHSFSADEFRCLIVHRFDHIRREVSHILRVSDSSEANAPVGSMLSSIRNASRNADTRFVFII